MHVELQLAKQVYKNAKIDASLLKRIIDLAFNNPGLAFFFNGEKFYFEKGLFELARRVDPAHAQLIGDETIIYEGINTKGKKSKRQN